MEDRELELCVILNWFIEEGETRSYFSTRGQMRPIVPMSLDELCDYLVNEMEQK